MKTDDLIAGLPGEELVREGIKDLLSGRWTVASCLVAVARTRMTNAGLLPTAAVLFPPQPERELYRLLRQQTGDAYGRYNALLRELVSFEMALDRRLRTQINSL